MVYCKRHKEYKPSPSRRFQTSWSCLGLALAAWLLIPLPDFTSPKPLLPSEMELLAPLQEMSFSKEQLPSFDPKQQALALFGKKLFFDPQFSANGKVACASCHIPEKAFSDGRPKGLGLEEGKRKTPSLVNSFAADWFFWDGRADSLSAQALGPIEQPGEHGISRTHLVRKLKASYNDDYTRLFGPWPEALNGSLPAEAMPARIPLVISPSMSAYTLASLDSFFLQDAILSAARRHQLSPQAHIAQLLDPSPVTPLPWAEAWQKLPLPTQEAINQVFSHFGIAIAAYEKGLIAVDAPFDRFVARLAETKKATRAFSPDFGPEEWHGLRLFFGPGQCSNCHHGPRFSDQQFHNIGLKLAKKSEDASLDGGRLAGAPLVLGSPFNCLGPYLEGHEEGEGCRELPYLKPDNLELVGAFKTPSLRNVALRPPYGHDGRFPDLASVLDHYNRLADTPAMGHREETLQPLNFKPQELKALEAFLRALSAPIIDSTTGTLARSPQAAINLAQ